MTGRNIRGDAREQLAQLPAGSVQCCVTSPPYWSLRSYLPDSDPLKAYELGSEPTPAAFVANLVDVMRGVWRVLREDGTVWLNCGDTYSSTGGHTAQGATSQRKGRANVDAQNIVSDRAGIPPKNLCLIPERLALALQEAGWIVRSVITWVKTAPMPESVVDRPTSATERIFLLAKSPRYYYDAEAVREPSTGRTDPMRFWKKDHTAVSKTDGLRNDGERVMHLDASVGANMRNAWVLSPEPTKMAHFATFPSEIPRRAILAGTSEHGACGCCGAPWKRVVERAESTWEARKAKGEPVRAGLDQSKLNGRAPGWAESQQRTTTGWAPTCRHTDAPVVPCVILDPFAGSGTSLMVAEQLGRSWVGIELSAANIKLIEQRTAQRGFASVPVEPRAGGVRGKE